MSIAKREKISDLFSKDELQELTKKNDFIAGYELALRIFIHIFLIMLTWFFMQEQYIILALACFYFNASLWHFLGYAGIGHELSHSTVFSSKKINIFFYKFFSYLTWNNPFYFSKQHMFHHKSTFHQDDVEIFRYCLPTKAIFFVRFFLFDYLTFFKRLIYAISNAIGYEAQFKGLLFSFSKIPPERKEICTQARNILLIQVLLVVGSYLITHSFLLSLLLFITPFTASGFNMLLALTQHIGLDKNVLQGNLFHSRTIILPKLVAFWYANMNYHAEHHLLPSVPYYNLPILREYIHKKSLNRLPEEDYSFLFSKRYNKLLAELNHA